MRLLSRPFSLFLLLTLVILFWLAGCQQDPDSERHLQPRPSRTPVKTSALTTVVPTKTRTVTATGTAVPTNPAPRQTNPPPATPTAPSTSPALSPQPLVTSSPTPIGILSPTSRPGALIGLTLNSKVGVLLDEIPAESRDQVAEALLQKPADYWQELARQQVRLTYNRLHFRPFFYGMLKGQLPLPPETLWQINLNEAGPRRETVGGHDYVLLDYEFSGTLLTDAASPAEAEFQLGQEGGQWFESFVLPVDPTLLLQRTSNTCINEGGFPPNSYDSENIFLFYDYTCTADSGGAGGCHRSQLPTLSCLEALGARVGMVETGMRFERLPWDRQLADEVRIGQVVHANAPDLLVVGTNCSQTALCTNISHPTHVQRRRVALLVMAGGGCCCLMRWPIIWVQNR